MVVETLIICVTLYLIFGPYWRAKARELEEKVRQDEIENDMKEFGKNEKDDL